MTKFTIEISSSKSCDKCKQIVVEKGTSANVMDYDANTKTQVKTT